jgi:VWFA-related protein
MRPLTIALAGLVLLGPAAPQRPTFTSGAALVEVDVIALDRHGEFVPDLRAEDLTLLEDGKPQAIEQFYLVTHDLDAGNGRLAAPGTSGETRYGAHRLFVLLFDEGHLAQDSLQRIVQGAEAFVRDQVGPDDFAGVFVNNSMYHGRLSRNKTELIAGIRSSRPTFDNRQSLLAAFREFPQIPSEWDAVRVSDGARELVDRLGADACREQPPDCAAAGGVQQVENLIQQKSRYYVRQARRLADQTLQNLDVVVSGLTRIRGRKTVLFLTEGFFVEDYRERLGRIGGTVIYSIDARGLINHLSPNTDAVRQSRARSTAFDTGEDGPFILTSGTGGFVVSNVDEMSRAFGLVVRDTSTYYVLGFSPANPRMDGRFRKIEVKTRVPGLQIRARRGYAAVDLPPQQDPWR